MSAHREEGARATRFALAGDPATARDGSPQPQVCTIPDQAIDDVGETKSDHTTLAQANTEDSVSAACRAAECTQSMVD